MKDVTIGQQVWAPVEGVWVRSVVAELHGPVCKINTWIGKKAVMGRSAMVKFLRPIAAIPPKEEAQKGL